MNFDKKINRYNTKSLKYDCKKGKNVPTDVFPMWVADMDFKSPKPVIKAMKKKLNHGVFGYSQTDDHYFNVLYNWFQKRYDVKINEDWLIKTPGVTFALAMAVRALTKEKDYVLINNPVYHCFKEVIEDNSRKVITSSLIKKNNHYEIDFDDLENKIKKYKIKLYLFCSPHNPVGRVWTKKELDKLIDICQKHNVIIVSDEIHCDFIWEGKHTNLLKYKKYLNNIIVCTAPSKTFNIPGLQISNIFIPNKEIYNIIQNEIWKTGYSLVNIMAITACEAAYEYGEEYLEELKDYLKTNIIYTEKFIEKNIPKIKVIHSEGTYLLWLDFKGTNLSEEEIENKLLTEAKLWLNDGSIFGKEGRFFQRLNIALPKKELKQALEKLKETFK